MKIFIIGSAYPLRGGIAVFVERMAEVLMDLGHDVTIYSFSLQYPNFLFPGKTQYSDEAKNPRLNIRSKINSVNPINWLRVGDEIKKSKPDLVLVKFWLPFFGPSLGTIFSQIRKNDHTKIISILDNVIPHEKRFGDIAFTKYFLKRIDAGLTMSKSVLEDLRSLGSNIPAAYTPHPMYDNYLPPISREEALRHLKLDPHKKYVLFFGFIRKYKGLDLLLQAFADERIKNSNIELIIAGEYYEDSKPYKAVIEENNLHDTVHLFDDFIPNADVHYYFSACDIVAQPYRSATQSGISQIAYYYSKPMLVTDVGGLPEIVKDEKTGWIVPVDSTEIATGILKAFHDNQYKTFHDSILEERKRFEWSYFIEVIMDLYRKIS